MLTDVTWILMKRKKYILKDFIRLVQKYFEGQILKKKVPRIAKNFCLTEIWKKTPTKTYKTVSIERKGEMEWN